MIQVCEMVAAGPVHLQRHSYSVDCLSRDGRRCSHHRWLYGNGARVVHLGVVLRDRRSNNSPANSNNIRTDVARSSVRRARRTVSNVIVRYQVYSCTLSYNDIIIWGIIQASFSGIIVFSCVLVDENCEKRANIPKKRVLKININFNRIYTLKLENNTLRMLYKNCLIKTSVILLFTLQSERAHLQLTLYSIEIIEILIFELFKCAQAT